MFRRSARQSSGTLRIDALIFVLGFPMTFLTIVAAISSNLTPCASAELDAVIKSLSGTTISTYSCFPHVVAATRPTAVATPTLANNLGLVWLALSIEHIC